MKMYDGISVGTVQRRRRAPVERFLELEVIVPSKDDQKDFTEIMAALQFEVESLRDTSRKAGDILQGLSKFWLDKISISDA